jgi:branched-chain amino acid transport system substrate-binding protein
LTILIIFGFLDKYSFSILIKEANNMAKRISVLALSLVIVFFAVSPLAAADTIKIGAILAVTGPAANLGAPEAKTLQMLADDTNKAGGILGRQIQLILKDSQYNADLAYSFAKQLIDEEQVVAIIGPSGTGESMKIKPLCEENEMLLLSCAAGETIVNPVAKWVFKTPQMDKFAAQWIFDTMKKLRISKIAVVVSNSGFGQGGKAQLEGLAPENGITILGTEVYDSAATDLTPVVTKIKALNPQAVVNWSVEPAQSLVSKNMAQIGLKVPLFQSHGFGNIKYAEAAGKAAEGIIFPCGRLLVADVLPASHPQKQLLMNYKKEYESMFKEDVSTFGGHAYDAYTLLINAIKKAGSLDKYKIRDAVENTKGFAGTAGIFNFSPTEHNGLTMDSFEMLTVKDGKFVLYTK